MIDEKSLSKEWIEELRTGHMYRRAHPELMEKMIYALYLVEKLSANNLDFVFKGGTSLTLLFPEIKRFSIDVDIITNTGEDDLEKILAAIVKDTSFTRFELDEERSFVGEFPKAHYDIFYTSQYDKAENNILLDVVFDETPYPEIIEVPVKNKFLSTSGSEVNVKVPSINSITGDKLTAFAPNTIGIKYNTGKDLHIIKQLFDIGWLFDEVDNLESVYKTFKKVTDTQLKYQTKEFSYEDILQDTIDTAFLLGMQNNNKDEAKTKFNELKAGVRKFPPYLPDPKYSLHNAIEDAAKSALLAAKLMQEDYNDMPTIEKKDYSPKDFPIDYERYRAIYKMIKGMPNLSVFYWHHTSKLFFK